MQKKEKHRKNEVKTEEYYATLRTMTATMKTPNASILPECAGIRLSDVFWVPHCFFIFSVKTRNNTQQIHHNSSVRVLKCINCQRKIKKNSLKIYYKNTNIYIYIFIYIQLKPQIYMQKKSEIKWRDGGVCINEAAPEHIATL